MAWVDAARGIGIIFVVYGHALRGHVTSGAFDRAWHADLQDKIIYAFHMPLFFFLAGLFVEQSLRKGPAAFARNKGWTLVYPYFLWSTVSVVLGLAAANIVNSAPHAGVLFDLWRTPVYQYWFLYALLLCQVVALATQARRAITIVLCGLSAVLGSMVGADMPSVAVQFYVYFGLGILVAPWLLALRPTVTIIVVVVPLLVGSFAATFMIDAALPTRVIELFRAMTGGAAVVAIAMLVAANARWLVVAGAASMSIYVLHTIFSSAVRMALNAVGLAAHPLALAAGTAAGLLAPVAIWAVARRYHALSWLGLGAEPRLEHRPAA